MHSANTSTYNNCKVRSPFLNRTYVREHFGGPKYLYDPFTQTVGAIEEAHVRDAVCRRLRNDVASLASHKPNS